MKEVKVYRFYKLIKGATDEISIMDKYPLVAVTDNKKLAKDFEKTRDMSKYVKISDVMDEEVYVQFVNKHRGEEIDKESLLTTFDIETGEKRQIYLPYTSFEYICMQDYLEKHMMGPEGPNQIISILNKKYTKALETLMYDQIANHNLGISEDYDFPQFEYNELSLFIAVYKEYLSI